MTESPGWARGYDLALLKAHAALFKARLGPHIHGAFGLPKEREVADALAANALVWTKREGQLAGSAIVRRLAQSSQHEDFAGRIARPQAGDVFVKAIAGDDAAIIHILVQIEQRAGAPIWVEAHIEDRALAGLIEGLGYEHVMTKVAASSDLKGLWLRGAPPDAGAAPALRRRPRPMEAADVPALAILCEDFISADDRERILAEAEAHAEWAQHYSGYNKRQSWTAFAIHGFDQGDPGFIIKPAEMSKAWKAENPERLKAECGPTIAAPHFPTAMDAVARLQGRPQRVRLMRLAAGGGELTRHADITDPEAGTAEGKIMRLHIPLRSPPECLFRGWGLDGAEARVRFPERALCYLDTRKPHAVINPGAADRIHLVIDLFATRELRASIAKA